jgi:hypothetical protein
MNLLQLPRATFYDWTKEEGFHRVHFDWARQALSKGRCVAEREIGIRAFPDDSPDDSIREMAGMRGRKEQFVGRLGERLEMVDGRQET